VSLQMLPDLQEGAAAKISGDPPIEVAVAVKASLLEDSLTGGAASKASLTCPTKDDTISNAPAPEAPVITPANATSNISHQSTQMTQKSSEPSLTKSAMRFIRDVTFPDASKVQSGAVFAKIWRVRNDGEFMWPEGTVLITAGGDLLTPADLKEMVPRAQPGEEVQISATLTAPNTTGRHTAYFRLQTKEGVSFGQRLWADVVVEEEEEPSWDVVSSAVLNPAPLLPAPELSTSSDVVVNAKASDASALVDESNLPIELAVQDSAAPLASVLATDVWSRVWAAELEVLAQMGFSDSKTLIPILQEHVGVPALITPETRGIPNADGMQRAVMVLLGLSAGNR